LVHEVLPVSRIIDTMMAEAVSALSSIRTKR